MEVKEQAETLAAQERMFDQVTTWLREEGALEKKNMLEERDQLIERSKLVQTAYQTQATN